jgi:universal stress protein A
MFNFKTIVLTTDLSENSKAAIPYAVQFARQFNGEIHLLCVLEDIANYFSEAMASGIIIGESAWVDSIHKEQKKQLEALASALGQEEKIKIHPVCRTHRKPANEIVRYAGEIGADCIVIATHGHSGLSHLILGSVAERVVRLSPCPVLTVKPKE